jgi:hypothetical protein
MAMGGEMDLKTLFEQKRQEMERVKAQYEALQDEVQTLEKTFAIAERAGIALTSQPTPQPKGKRNERKKKQERKPKAAGNGRSLAGALRKIVSELEPPISTGAVRERLRTLDPDLYEQTYPSSLASTMRRMADRGELEVVERGGPGKEATYRLPSNPQPMEEIS